MRDVVVLLGNGFLFDLFQKFEVNLADWHPQNLTRWATPPTLADGRNLIDCLPRFASFVSARKEAQPTLGDFEHFRAILDQTRPEWIERGLGDAEHRARFERGMVEPEARHFIAGALSYLQEKVVDGLPIADWQWTSWFAQYSERLSAITSFNYDLVAETALRASGVPFRRLGLASETGDVGIHKPHGSIDFAINPHDVFAPISYPLQNHMSLMNTSIVRMDRLTVERLHAEIVLPSEASKIQHFQWVQAGRAYWRSAARTARHVVLVGLSYWKCDQGELDGLLEDCPTSTKIHICNPAPSVLWISELVARFGQRNVVHCVAPPAL